MTNNFEQCIADRPNVFREDYGDSGTSIAAALVLAEYSLGLAAASVGL